MSGSRCGGVVGGLGSGKTQVKTHTSHAGNDKAALPCGDRKVGWAGCLSGLAKGVGLGHKVARESL